MSNHDVPITFILEHWFELNSIQKQIAVTSQKFIPKLPSEKLVAFLVDEVAFIREIAIETYVRNENG